MSREASEPGPPTSITPGVLDLTDEEDEEDEEEPQPPLNPGGSARTTEILDQRFGPFYSRRFFQPIGATFPFRPLTTTKRYRPVERPVKITRIPKREEHRPISHPTGQNGQKTVDLAEFQKAFCDDTPVRDVLASGWYRNQLIGKTDEEIRNMPSTSQRPPGYATGKPIQNQEQHFVQQFGQEALEKAQKMISRTRGRSLSIKREQESVLLPQYRGKIGKPPVPSDLLHPHKEQFSRETVEKAQELQQHAQQVVKRRQGMVTSTLLTGFGKNKPPPVRVQNMMNKQQTTPNILRKNRNTDSPIPVQVPMQMPNPIPVPSTSNPQTMPMEDKEREKLLETPRKRARKQILEADDYVGTPSPSRSIPIDPMDEEKKKTMESIQQLNAIAMGASPPASALKALVPNPIPVAPVVTPIVVQVMAPPPPPSRVPIQPAPAPPPPKKRRGRPRKDQTQVQFRLPTPTQPQPPKPIPLPRTPKKPRVIIERPKPPPPRMQYIPPIDNSDAEKERLALIQALPSNLIDAINAQKVLDKEQLKNPKKVVGRKPRKKVEFDNPVTQSLRFLESITKLDPNIFGLGGLLDDDESSPPQATAVPTSVQPLDLELNMPRLKWTDDTGPLVPRSMYVVDEPEEKVEKVVEKPKFMEPKIKLEPKKVELEEEKKIVEPEKVEVEPEVVEEEKDEEEEEEVEEEEESEYSSSSEGGFYFETESSDDEEVDEEPETIYEEIIEEGIDEMIPVIYLDNGIVTKTIQSPPKVVWKKTDKVVRKKNHIPRRKKQRNLKLKKALKVNNFPILQLVRKTKRMDHFNLTKFYAFCNCRNSKFLSLAYNENYKVPCKTDRILEKINARFDSLVRTCSTVRFEEKLDHVLGIFSDGNVRFDVDENSTNSGSRWLAWHENVINKCVYEGTKDSLLGKYRQFNPLVKKSGHLIKKMRSCGMDVRDVRDFVKTLKLCHSKFQKKVDKLHLLAYTAVSLSDTFRIKREALQLRLDKINWEKANYRTNDLENRIVEWQQSVIEYNAASLPVDRTFRRKTMSASFQKLKRALYHYDSLVDTSMFASRLRILFFHTEQLYSQSMDIVEILEAVQACEDTEYYLLLCEVKLKLIDQTDNNDRVKLINVYLSADATNIAKGRLRRLMSTPMQKKAEVALVRKIKRLIMRARNAGLIDVADWMSSIPDKNWKERNARECRINIFDEMEDYETELAAKLLATSTLRVTLVEMWVKLAHLTSVADEKLKSAAEREKNEPKHYLRTMVPQFRNGGQGQPNPAPSTSCSATLLENLKMEFVSRKVSFKPAMMNESQLRPEIFNKFHEFRRLKRMEMAQHNNATTFMNSDDPEKILKKIGMVSLQPKTEENQQLIEKYRMLYQKVQKQKGLERQSGGETRGAKSSVVVKKDWDYVNMLDELEFFNGISDDEFDENGEEDQTSASSSSTK